LITPLRILEAVRARRDEWVSYLTALALLESPTTDRSSQFPVQDLLADSLVDLDYKVRRVRGTSSAGLILGVPSSPKGSHFQLLLGHTDTVWPTGSLETMPVRLSGSVLSGPGVFDMKSGLTHVVMALRVLKELALEPEVSPIVLCNSDEETGSLESTRHIRRISRRADRVFVLEPPLGLEGRIKTERKGTGRFSVRIVGRSAHAGLDPEKGASAIHELARVVQSLYRLTSLEEGVVVNVGEIHGGIRPNVVAAEAKAEVDVRVRSADQGRRIEASIRGLEATAPGCHLEIEGGMDRPPLERTARNQRLWREARLLGEEMGIQLEEGRAGGASDGNTTSVYTATLDGLGGVGDGAHAVHEYVDVDRSLERCALLAALLLTPLLPKEGPNAEE
jgi:glutamate carboxypeptidase